MKPANKTVLRYLFNGFNVSHFGLHVSNKAGAWPHSHGPVVNFLFEGAKRWVLWKARTVGNAQVIHLPQNLNAEYKLENWFEEYYMKYPSGHYGEPLYDFIQLAGEALF